MVGFFLVFFPPDRAQCWLVVHGLSITDTNSLILIGKSSISLRLVRSKWTNEYDPTIQDSYSTTRVVDGRTYQLALTDTAGQEEYADGIIPFPHLSSFQLIFF